MSNAFHVAPSQPLGRGNHPAPPVPVLKHRLFLWIVLELARNAAVQALPLADRAFHFVNAPMVSMILRGGHLGRLHQGASAFRSAA